MIKLISKSLIRYEGCLQRINQEESTVTLTKVRSFGSEGRRNDVFIPPSNHVYPCIVFRAPDIAELDVLEQNDFYDDPAKLDPAIVSMQQQTPVSAQTPADVVVPQQVSARVPAPTHVTRNAAASQRVSRNKPPPIGSAAPGSAVRNQKPSKSTEAAPPTTAWGKPAPKSSAPPARKAWDTRNKSLGNAPRRVNSNNNPIGTRRQMQTNSAPVANRQKRQPAPVRRVPAAAAAAASKSSTANRPSAWGKPAASSSQTSKKWSAPAKSAPGMGSHLMGGKKVTPRAAAVKFDFEAMLAKALKADVKEAAQVQTVAVYTGDSFFDNLSTDTTGRSKHVGGPQFRKEQNDQNMETFGQIRLNRPQRNRNRYQQRGNNGPRRRTQYRGQQHQQHRQNRGQQNRMHQNNRSYSKATNRPPRRYYRTDTRARRNQTDST